MAGISNRTSSSKAATPLSCRENARAFDDRNAARRRRIAGAIAAGCAWAVALCAHAAEWSLTPTYSSSVDYDSNRALEIQPTASESAVLTVDLRLQRALEDSSILVEPRYSLRRFSDTRFGDGDDRSLATVFQHSWERSVASLNASIFDQSTLTTELLETGLVRADIHQRLIQANGAWKWSVAENRRLFVNLTDSDVHYHGAFDADRVLPGYKYRVASLGETFIVSPTVQLDFSAFGSQLESDTAGNSSREYGLQAQLTYAWSDRTRFIGAYGRSERVLAGRSSPGTDINVSLTHDVTLGSISLSYVRSLVAIGQGFLEQREVSAATMSRELGPHLKATLSYTHAKNDEIAVIASLDRPHYTYLLGTLDWHPLENWAMGLQLGSVRTTGPGFFLQGQTVSEWRSSVYLNWTPRPRVQSW